MARCFALVILAALSLMGGCVAPASLTAQNYQGSRATPTSSAVFVEHEDDLGPGAVLLGRSEYVSAQAAADGALECAREIGANAVVARSEYLGTASGAVPIQQYNMGGPTTSHSYYSGTAQSPGGGYATMQGTATHTAYQPGYYTTTYMPVSVPRFRHVTRFYRDPSRPGIEALREASP